MDPVSERISNIGIVPVIKLDHPERDSAALAKALCAGGVPVAEVTFRAPHEETAVRIMKQTCPDMLVGGGTVTNTSQIDAVIEAGGDFIVTPGFDAELVAYAQKKNIPVYPGCSTATDYHQALKSGLEIIKFFPAEQSGGLARIKALSGPFPMFKVMPTGGIDLSNLKEYISDPVIAACGGSYLVTADLIDNNRWDEITELCRRSVEIVREARALAPTSTGPKAGVQEVPGTKKVTGDKVFKTVTVCLFALVIALVWIMGLAGLDSGPDTETGEIRELAAFPEEYSNDWFARINAYFNDHSPMRNSVISGLNRAERAMSDYYEKHVMDPLYEALLKANATPEPTEKTLAPDRTAEPTPTPDFSGLFGDETEKPAESPGGPSGTTPTPEPTPTSAPTQAPDPTPTPFEGEHAELVADTLDAIVIGDVINFGLGDGSGLSKLGEAGGIVDNSDALYDSLVMRGWAGFSQEIESFGYRIGKAEPVFSPDNLTSHEAAVENAGGAYARRFYVTVPLEGLKGDVSVCLAVRFVTGEIIFLDGEEGNISFTVRGEEQFDGPVVIDASFEVSKNGDVMLDCSKHTELEVKNQALTKIAAEKSANKNVQFLFRDSWFVFDNDAFKALAAAAGNGKDLTFESKEVLISDLTDAQKNAVSDKIVGAVFSVRILAGTEPVTDLKGAKVTVNLKYQKPSDADIGDIRVAAFAEDGSIKRVAASYNDGVFTFRADISSGYLIYIEYGSAEETPHEGASDPSPTPSGSASCSHDYVLIREQEASFAHDGYTLERCSKCGNGKVSNIVLRTSLPGFYNTRRPITYEGSGFKGIHDWYFYTGNNSIGYFQGDNVLTDDECAEWASVYEELHRICESKGIKVAFLIPPNKEQVYGEYMPSGVSIVDDSQKREPLFVKYLKARNSPVHYVYPLSQLKSAKILYETYLQQDTHWNTVGGFIGAMQVYQSIGLPTTGLQNVEVTITDAAGGDLVSLGVGPAKQYTGYSIDYKPEITVTQTYMYSNTVVGGNDAPNSELRILESNAPTTAKAVIIGDSFRHAIAPYIAKDFCKVTVTHRGDFYTVSNTVAGPDGEVRQSGETVMQDALCDLKAGDLLLVMAVERYDDANVDMTRQLIDFFRGMK